MWLLADRFGVTLHRTSKVFPVDEMVSAKGGPKLQETTLDPKTTADSPEDGLKLMATKAPLDVLVIDKAEKEPTEN